MTEVIQDIINAIEGVVNSITDGLSGIVDQSSNLSGDVAGEGNVDGDDTTGA